jgi:Pyrroline-5-carboxylate reductase
MNIGFLGTGHITYSIILGIFKSNLKIKKIYISPRNKFIAKKLSKRFKKVTIAKDNQQLINKSNWVFLAITPQVGKKILSKLSFRQNQKIVSFISTITLTQLKKYIGKNNKIVRAIPMPPISNKLGPIPICPSDKKVKSFFSKLGNL